LAGHSDRKERKKDAEEGKKRRRKSFFLKGGFLRPVMSNTFVFIMIAAGPCFIICQGWPHVTGAACSSWLRQVIFR
jgi:hypothetical protein